MSKQEALQGRNIAVTGGSGALGGAVLAWLLDRGAICHVPCFEAEVPSFALAMHERVSATPGIDLSDEASVTGYYDGLPPLWGSIHLAGGFAMAQLTDTSAADFGRMHTLNALTCFLSCREAVRSMRKGKVGGRIVNVAARPALSPVGGMVAYTASKAAVASMTQTLADELLPDGIWVNAVLPSIIDTEANRRSMPGADVSKWPRPEQIARTIGFLVSPDNELTSGALVPVYGGA